MRSPATMARRQYDMRDPLATLGGKSYYKACSLTCADGSRHTLSVGNFCLVRGHDDREPLVALCVRIFVLASEPRARLRWFYRAQRWRPSTSPSRLEERCAWGAPRVRRRVVARGHGVRGHAGALELARMGASRGRVPVLKW